MNSCAARVTGSLLSGALGDALGYPVKFTDLDDIERRYGTTGLPARLIPNPKTMTACISDATQLTLFTADGLIHAAKTGANPAKSVYGSYLKWLYTQDGGLVQHASSGIMAHEELYVTRAPAATTLHALHSGAMGSLEVRINTSKSSDAVMRVAPAGYIARPNDAFILGEQIAAITHGHPDGYRAAGAFAYLISVLVEGETLAGAVTLLQNQLEKREWTAEVTTKLEEAVTLLGTGKTAERALAIGVFCALRHEGNLTGALRAAANHGGDSSVTAAVTGQILGAVLGRGAVPNEWRKELELAGVIEATGSAIAELRGKL